jgi:hypothetical protein
MSDLIRSAPDAVRAEGLPDGVLKFVLCRSGEVDAHTSIIEPGGVSLERHRTNPVFLWQHQSGTNAIGAAPGPEVVIGKVTEYQQDERELVITVLFDLEDDLAATCYRKCKQGFLNGVSIGCRVDADAARIEKIDGIDVTIYPKSTLLEASLVILPSLGSALRVDRTTTAMLLRSLGGEVAAAPVADRSTEAPPVADVVATPTAPAVDTPAAIPSPVVTGSTLVVDPSQLAPNVSTGQNKPPESVSEPVASDQRATSTSIPVRSLPYTRDIVQPGLTPGENIAYTAKVVPMKPSREYRGMIRGLMNMEMDVAEMHGYLAEMDGVQDEMRASHREAMKCGLKRAEDMVRLIAIDLDDDEGEGMERLVPGLKDAEMRALFAGTAQKVGKLPLTLRQVVKDRFGTEDPITVETRAMAWQGSQERLKKLTDEKRALANAAQSEERERLIAQYLDPKVALITPAEAQEMRGLNPATGEPSGKPAWSPERVHTLIRERGGAPIVEIARVAPLATVAGAPAAVPGVQPMVQREGVNGGANAAAPAILTRNQELAAGIRVNTSMTARDSAQVEAHISEGAAALGITPEALREHMARKAGK